MVEDRELLEQAAKAAGLEIMCVFNAGAGLTCHIKSDGQLGKFCWAPLQDDGDAFRLMVALSLAVQFDGPAGMCVNYTNERGRLCTVEQIVQEDLAAAVRRAIVSAAAELAMPK